MSVDQKKLKAVIKEGGKRGVEIIGVAEMGGLEFFCTKVEEPEGDVELTVESMNAMNKEIDPNDEESKGGSGSVGKMIFSTSNSNLAVVAYVPTDKQDKINAKDWLSEIITPYEGEVIEGNATLAKGLIKADVDKGRFTLKVRDEALSNSIAYLRARKLFPEQEDDSDDDFVMGDDDLGDL
ncbi:hypothetical protein BZG36_03487 [Bifiguratus adelaidae]|uniref:Uncharacterized protein n=1 Tax=Bifiguratus adelaidae TaxID=1938954 RepID=A0A261XWM6_9FUNG|nr:hypothetical protein BZG36_03487 [Bifiguratus adelaidae]